MRDAYDVWLDNLLLPVTPSSMTIKTDNKNETVTLVDGGDINIVKTPGLTEVSFDFLVPALVYPFNKTDEYPIDIIQQLARFKLSKRPFYFRVIRQVPIGLESLDSGGNYNMYTRAEKTNSLLNLDSLNTVETSNSTSKLTASSKSTRELKTASGTKILTALAPIGEGVSNVTRKFKYTKGEVAYYIASFANIMAKNKAEKDLARAIEDVTAKAAAKRNNPTYSLFDQRMLVTIEDYSIKEDAEEYGFDFLVSITLKQYREYGTKIVMFSTDHTTATVTQTRAYEPVKTRFNYTTVKGDSLGKISKVYYGTEDYWENIKNENSSIIASYTWSSQELPAGLTLQIPAYNGGANPFV